jgi:C4-dicarboxylate-specific signal transduction histidine kinase
MSKSRDRRLRDEGFEFWGAITASLSHDINNVFAIINELSGLLDDFFHAADQGGGMDIDKLRSTTRRISEQVSRGQTHVRQLNKFAHTVDHRRATIAVNDDVEAVATLCGRIATLRRIKIATRLADVSPQLEGCAFDVQHVIFRCIDMALDAGEQGDVVDIAVEPHNDGVRLTVANRSAVASVHDLETKQDSLAMLVAEMNGTVESVISVGQPLRLTVSLPRSLNTTGN